MSLRSNIFLSIVSAAIAFLVGTTYVVGENERQNLMITGENGRDQVRSSSPSNSKLVINGHRGSPNPVDNRLKVLQELAIKSPEVIAQINVDLFDQDLNVNYEDASLLGISPEKVRELEGRFKSFYLKLQKIESTEHVVTKGKNNEPVVITNALAEDERQQMRNQFKEILGSVFTEELADPLAENLLKRNRPLFASLEGYDRVIRIDLTSEETFNRSRRGARIDVMYLRSEKRPAGGVNPQLDFPPGYVDRNDQIVDRLPVIYQHFFEEE